MWQVKVIVKGRDEVTFLIIVEVTFAIMQFEVIEPQILPKLGLHCISAAAHSTFTRDSIPASVRICLVFGADLLAAVSCKRLKMSSQHMAGNYEN